MQVLQQRDETPSRRSKVSVQLDLNKPTVQTFFSPPSHALNHHRIQLSPDQKKGHSPQLSSQLSPRKSKQTKLDNILFTIEENYYFRKNINNISPRPPKYRAPNQRGSFCPEPQNNDTSRERKVFFTQNLISDRPPMQRKEVNSPRSIMRSSSLTKHNQDNLSSSSISMRSISVQNSFVSQLKTSMAIVKERHRIDHNKQKYSKIMSYFEGNKQAKRREDKSKIRRIKKDEEEEKYTDSIFPPVPSSLFLLGKQKLDASQIKWKRLSDFPQSQHVVLLAREQPSLITLDTSGAIGECEFLVIALNALKHCKCILERIFEDQSYNDYGLYLVKIFQQNNWKSIILDDFVPHNAQTSSGSPQIPFLIDVRPQLDFFEVWPFLLLKAFANYYSAYELMMYGNVIDLLNELTGLVPIQTVKRKKSQKQLVKLKTKLQIKDAFAIAERNDIAGKFYIIRHPLKSNNFLLYSEFPSFRELELDATVFNNVKSYYIYNPIIFHTLSTATIGRYHPGHKIQERTDFSLRKLVVQENTDCLISLQQKEKRFFCKSSLNYSYMWMRVILVQREYNGYRWIQGNYTNLKSTVLSVTLCPGEYYLIIMPEWKKTHNHQLTLLIWANHFITIQKEKNSSCEQMVELACMDLAQRKGSISQLKTTLCSYNYICSQTGFIIENINNEKLKEDIKIKRRISGIPCSVELLPINKQFWETKDSFKEEIEVIIPKLSSFTVVLKMRGGMDLKLIQLFKGDREK